MGQLSHFHLFTSTKSCCSEPSTFGVFARPGISCISKSFSMTFCDSSKVRRAPSFSLAACLSSRVDQYSYSYRQALIEPRVSASELAARMTMGASWQSELLACVTDAPTQSRQTTAATTLQPSGRRHPRSRYGFFRAINTASSSTTAATAPAAAGPGPSTTTRLAVSSLSKAAKEQKCCEISRIRNLLLKLPKQAGYLQRATWQPAKRTAKSPPAERPGTAEEASKQRRLSSRTANWPQAISMRPQQAQLPSANLQALSIASLLLQTVAERSFRTAATASGPNTAARKTLQVLMESRPCSCERAVIGIEVSSQKVCWSRPSIVAPLAQLRYLRPSKVEAALSTVSSSRPESWTTAMLSRAGSLTPKYPAANSSRDQTATAIDTQGMTEAILQTPPECRQRARLLAVRWGSASVEGAIKESAVPAAEGVATTSTLCLSRSSSQANCTLSRLFSRLKEAPMGATRCVRTWKAASQSSEGQKATPRGNSSRVRVKRSAVGSLTVAMGVMTRVVSWHTEGLTVGGEAAAGAVQLKQSYTTQADEQPSPSIAF